jgi:Na+/H+-dicarboxylate symporter
MAHANGRRDRATQAGVARLTAPGRAAWVARNRDEGRPLAKKLTRFILFALLLGVIAGWATNAAIDDGSPASDERLKAIADYLGIITALFLRLIKMNIAPLVFSTLVVGIAHMGDTAALGRVGLRSLIWFIGASLVSLTLGLILVNTLQPGVGLDLALPAADAASGIEKSGFSLHEFITHLVPASMVDAMAKNEILQIVIFSIFFGVAITAIGDAGKPLVRGIESLVKVMLQVTD